MAGPAERTMWTNPAPPGYPWKWLMVPKGITSQAAEELVDTMKEAGNKCMKNGDSYNALWKYNHALALCRDYSLSQKKVSLISSNCAQACLSLNFFFDAIHHASTAIDIDPTSDIVHKAHYRRAEAFRFMCTLPLPATNGAGFLVESGVGNAIGDYNFCYRFNQNTKALCEAIIMAVDYSQTHLLPILTDRDVQSGATTKLLHEMLHKPNAKHVHLDFFLMKMTPQISAEKPLDASGVQFAQLSKKSLGKRILNRLIELGMRFSSADVTTAVELLPNSKVATLGVIVSGCPGNAAESLCPAYEAAVKLGKQDLLACLVENGAVHPETAQEKVKSAKEEGNDYYKEKKYEEAFAKYYQALQLCQKHQLEEEEALIRGNCAQVCLQLNLLRDAFDHANECLQLDPDSAKGYYRRAEAVRRMLESAEWKKRAPKSVSFSTVVSDYCQCHKKAENLKCLALAIIVAVSHDCTKALSKVTSKEVHSGFTTTLLKELVTRQDTTQKHLSALLFTMTPEKVKGGYNAASIQASDLIQRKSVTSVKLFQKLIDLSMRITEMDVTVAVRVLPEHCIAVLKTFLPECLKGSKTQFSSACKEAIKAKKLQFIACLIVHGGIPDANDLMNITGWPQKKVDPLIDEYLMGVICLREVEERQREAYLGELNSVGDRAIAVATVKQLHEKGKALSKSGHLSEAMQIYQKAITICTTYDFRALAADVYYSAAQLHQEWGQFQLAFQLGTVSIEMKPSAKNLSLRADILRKALQSSEYTVPSNLNYEMVLYDYCNSFTYKESVKVLTDAIIVAVDSRYTTSLTRTDLPPLLAEEHVENGFTTRLLLHLLKREDTKEMYIRLLVVDMPIRSSGKRFDGSKIELAMLLKRKFTNKRILEILFECGMKATTADLQLALETISGDVIPSIELLCANIDGNVHDALESLCLIAFQLKKIKVVLHLLKKGYVLPCSSQELLMVALQKKSPDIAESLLSFCNLSEVDIGPLMSNSLANYPQLLSKMIDGGANPSGLGDKKPLAEVQLTTLSLSKKMDLMCLLLNRGSDCNHLCHTAQHHTTPIHEATLIALSSGGDTRVLDATAASKSLVLHPDGRLVNGNKETPLHLIVQSKWKREHSMKVLKALIETHRIPINPSIRDEKGKKATDFLKKNDKRMQLLAMAADRLQMKKAGKKSKKKGGAREMGKNGEESGTQSEVSEVISYLREESKDTLKNQSIDQKDKPEESGSENGQYYNQLSSHEKLELHLWKLQPKMSDYFLKVTQYPEENEVVESEGENEVITQNDNIEAEISSSNNVETVLTKCQVGNEGMPVENKLEVVERSVSPKAVEIADKPDEITTVMSEFGHDDFDGLPWEVEVTNNVLKFFKNDKKHPYHLRLRAAQCIYQLAEGKRGKELSREVGEHSLSLFEANVSKASRIIWQKAIQFSPRRTGPSSNPIYAQVIRVWEIVPDHGKLHHKIAESIKRIEVSNERGAKAFFDVCLLPQKKASVRHQEVLEIPQIYTQAEIRSSNPNLQHFKPAASPKEDEFNVTTFYSFSNAVLKSMLTGHNARRDFPFKEWPKEHEIIKLKVDESILLLGRSGTGKTTCCLYRLWNEFKNYWDPETQLSVVMLSRKTLVTLKASKVEIDDLEMKEAEAESSGEKKEEEVDKTEVAERMRTTSTTSLSHLFERAETEQEQLERDREKYEENGQKEDDGDVSEASEESGRGEKAMDKTDLAEFVSNQEEEPADYTSNQVVEEEIYEHLHQVFITKNYVLCAQMKKRFYDMVASHDFLEEHMEWEQKAIPFSFSDIADHAYPLFLTARQFYILLDNSIDDGECFFRPREKDGSLRVKILSSDYDHEDPDTLLDLEDSDSEDDERQSVTGTPGVTLASKQHALKYVEVTSLYFNEHIWPNISHKCGVRNLDPTLVWIEIQSFIKGSRAALQKGASLPLEDYLKIGNKMAPNFANQREKIFTIFKSYEEYCQNQRHNVFLFDECDLIHNIYRRLLSVKDLTWSIHSLYIDEVQDFTQAELSLYLHCCRDPNSLFFTGDTAQSIMRGIAFRFQDLRSAFHSIHVMVPQVKVPQKPHTLTINFRSHSGILQLAGSIIDLLKEFFPKSIDTLPEDSGMFSGPVPVILESCDESDLALLLSSNKRESSRIEFGAHQVVLVQSKEAKDKLPLILRGAIVLTIFESKGLEFDDVLLYNFFSDSMVDEKGWRVITNYLNEHEECVKVKRKLPGKESEPRSHPFDEKIHKALNSELKYLYTAITRAKCNLWIYDADVKRRLPMFDLWYKRDLVKVVGNDIDGAESQHSLIFASISTDEQWKVQGDYFMRRSRWEQAKHCYERAGKGNAYLICEANARLLVQRARRESKPQLFLEAAVDFFHSDEFMHNIHCLLLAAQCLRRAKPPKYIPAAELFEKLGKNGEALKCYRKAKDTENYVRLLEKEGRFNEVVKVFRSPIEALTKASEYTARGITLNPDLCPENLSYTHARNYAKWKDKATLVAVLEYMPDVLVRVRFLKEGGLYEKAFDVYADHNELDDAYRLASAQGLFNQGRKLARKNEDTRKEAEFFFHQIHAEYFIKMKERADTLNLPQEIRSDLYTLFNAKDPVVKAHASLLLGIGQQDQALCRTAHTLFLEQHRKVAALEAFNAMTEVGTHFKPPIKQILDSCTTAKEVQTALHRCSDLNQLVKQAISLYGVQKVSNTYLMPQNHNVWVSPELQQSAEKDQADKDNEGMLKLPIDMTRETLAKRFGGFVKEWLEKYKVRQELQQQIKSFELHSNIDQKNPYLLRSYHVKLPVKMYIDALVNYCKLGLVMNDERVHNTATSLILTVFSPSVAIYLPLCKSNMLTIRGALSIHKCFSEKIRSLIDFDEQNRIDCWLSAWRACCISAGHTEQIEKVLGRLEGRVNDAYFNRVVPSQSSLLPTPPTSSTNPGLTGIWKGHRFEAPLAFIFWKRDNKNYHIFNFWLDSCTLIRDSTKPMWAAKQAIYRFLGTVLQRKIFSISVMNVVDVLIIHSMSLFTMLTHLNFFHNIRQAKCIVPAVYQNCVQLFDELNTYKNEKGGKQVLVACADEVKQSFKYNRNRMLHSDCIQLLNAALDLLLGTYRRDRTISVEHQKKLKVLDYALRNETVAASGAAKHCLILALTLFANLIPYQYPRQFRQTYENFRNTIHRSSLQEKPPQFVRDAMILFKSPIPSPSLIIHIPQFIHYLLTEKVGPTTVKMFFDEKKKINFVLMPTVRKSAPTQQLPLQHPSSGIAPIIANQNPSVQSTSTIQPQMQPQISKPPSTGFRVEDRPHTAETSVVLENRGPEIPTTPKLPEETYQNRDTKTEMDQVSQFSPSTEWERPTDVGSEPSDLPIVQPGELAPAGGGEEIEEDIQKEEEEEEEEEGEEVPGMLVSHNARQSALKNLNPALLDPDIVTKQHCSICEVFLRVESVTEEEEEGEESQPVVVDSVEVYEAHVQSSTHSRNFALHTTFKKDLDEEYSPMVQDMKTLIEACEKGKSPSLVRVIDDMKEAVDYFDNIISRRTSNVQWRMGIQDIKKATERFQQLLKLGDRQYSEIRAKEADADAADRVHTGAGQAIDSDTEFDAEINNTERVLDDFHLELRSEKTKMRSRSRKKGRKGK